MNQMNPFVNESATKSSAISAHAAVTHARAPKRVNSLPKRGNVASAASHKAEV